MATNKALIFKKVPHGLPVAGQDLTIENVPNDANTPAPKDGVTLQSLYASFDPYIRGRLRPAHVKSYSPPLPLGEPITNSLIAKVLRSNNQQFKEGDIVLGFLPIQQYIVLDGEATKSLKPLENQLGIEDIRVFLGALGMPGLTAYSSLYKIGKPKKGETIFVSAASGAVGSLVGQIAKVEGLKVVGSVGSDDKLDYILKELGFDAGFNYKKEKTSDALARLAPDGIDIYYENVGGETLDDALAALKLFGRVVVCGFISQYNNKGEGYAVKNFPSILIKQLTVQGFFVGNPEFGPAYAAEHQKNVQKWIKEGTFKPLTYQTDGIDNAVEGLLDLYTGKNKGKAVLKF